MSDTTEPAETTDPAETLQPVPDPEPAEHDDDLGDDRLAEMARPFLDQPETTGELEVHHGPPPADTPDETPADDVTPAGTDMPDLRIGRSVFAELARATGEFEHAWPALPAPPTFIDGPDGLAAKFDEARAANQDGFFADKTELAAWMRQARANTYGSGIAA